MRRRWEQDGKDVQLASNEILPDFCYQLARAIRLGHESSQPASRLFLSPSVNAWEVTAMIGIDRSAG